MALFLVIRPEPIRLTTLFRVFKEQQSLPWSCKRFFHGKITIKKRNSPTDRVQSIKLSYFKAFAYEPMSTNLL
jgi:hypothetical protein